jgi:hypothetical protein
MLYQDNVYGQVEIDEPVILELMDSYEMQRLKEIDQAGYFEPYHPGSKHTRFEHSVGDFILLRKFSAPIEEQIAGLIHDVSHSAFSHAVDYALSGGTEKKQSHQDDYFEEYVLNSNIPRILEKHGFKTEYVLDENNFPLQENQLPDLCADRIDYSMRGFLAYKIAGPEKIREILENLIVQDEKWIFKDFNSAYGYAKLFNRLNRNYYSGITTAVMFRRVGDYLKYALDQKYAAKNDLYTTDRELMDKINSHLSKDVELATLWKRMNDSGGYENNPDNYDAEVYCKSRIIDPLCRHEGGIARVSDIDPGWKDVVAQESRPKRYFIKFLD